MTALSHAELEQLPNQNPRRHYEQMVAVATRARNELAVAISDGATRAAHARLANAYAWSAVNLWLAAQAVVDLESLPDDAEGIVWKVEL